jgi:hypothetical protein
MCVDFARIVLTVRFNFVRNLKPAVLDFRKQPQKVNLDFSPPGFAKISGTRS